jgi:archaellum component FlaC
MEKIAIYGFIVLIAIIGVESFAFLSTYSSLNALQTQYNTLSTEHAELTSEYNTLTGEYNDLQTEHSQLQTTYSNLQSSYNSLHTSYNSLQTRYTNLDNDYNDLEDEYYSYVSGYEDLVSQVNVHSFHPSYAEQDLIDSADPDVADKVWDITGGWSDTLDRDEYWADVKAMYDWVVANIAYRADGYYPILPDDPRNDLTLWDDMWQTPAQTLELGKGDCEDMSILLVSMIRCYNDDQYYTEVIVITGHAAVYLPFEDNQICILDPAGHYYTNTGYPNYHIYDDTATEVNSWLNQWNIWAPEDAPHEINWIFSSYIWEDFTSNHEFINWLNGRE